MEKRFRMFRWGQNTPTYQQEEFDSVAKELKGSIEAESEAAVKRQTQLDEETTKREAEITNRSQYVTILQKQIGTVFHKQLTRKEILKQIFFYIITAILVAILIFVGFILFRLSKNDATPNTVAFVSAVVGGLTALLALPKIVAQYLFDPRESEKTVDLITAILSSDKPDKNAGNSDEKAKPE